MLKQTEQAKTEWKHTPPARPASQEVSGGTEQRFDKSAAQDILETATRLQQAEQDTLSEAELETLAAEMGISPRHVRQAIALSGRSARTTSTRRSRLRLERRQKQFAVLLPMIYGLYMVGLVLTTSGVGQGGPLQSALIYGSLGFAPLVLSAFLGQYLRYKRAGAAVGMWVVACMILGVIVGVSIKDGRIVGGGGPELWMLLLMVLAGAGAGVAGAAVGQWLTNRQPPYLPTVIKPSDLDR